MKAVTNCFLFYITVFILSFSALQANAQQKPAFEKRKEQGYASPNVYKTLADSLTAYACMMVTSINDNEGKIESIEFFNCGLFSTISGESLKAFLKMADKKKRKKEAIDTLLKRAYEKEVLSLEQKHCVSDILSTYFGKVVKGYFMLDDVLTSLTIFESQKTIELKDAELTALFEKAKEKQGYDIMPYFKKYIKHENQLLEKWHKYD